jgi:hypothetical protein
MRVVARLVFVLITALTVALVAAPSVTANAASSTTVTPMYGIWCC